MLNPPHYPCVFEASWFNGVPPIIFNTQERIFPQQIHRTFFFIIAATAVLLPTCMVADDAPIKMTTYTYKTVSDLKIKADVYRSVDQAGCRVDSWRGFDRTANGSPLKWFSIIDEYTRENLCLKVGRSVTSENVIDSLAKIIVKRGVPKHIRSDNGPESVAKSIQKWLKDLEIQTM